MTTGRLELEEAHLAPWAMKSRLSRGRSHPEPDHPWRSIFQRDRERIVHSTAFRRLMGKTQVLVGQINDHHRTRLTHTLEVAQIARTIARRLRLHEDLTEAVALSHDIGHPPFGHAAEGTLAELMRERGGFDHNLYGLRRVDLLEDRYPEFPGLNLSWELRESFVQHSKSHHFPEAREFLSVGGPLLESQLVDVVDSLAYDSHDTDDALGIGLIQLGDLEEVELWRQLADVVRNRYANLRGNEFRTATIREMIASQADDLIAETESRLERHKIRSIDDVRACRSPLVGFSPELTARRGHLETFLRERVYRHHEVARMARQGKRIIRRLFGEFCEAPTMLPPRHQRRWIDCPQYLRSDPAEGAIRVGGGETLERVVADYLAGMTDRFARQEYLRIFQPGDR